MSANRRQFIGAIGAALAAIGFSPKDAAATPKPKDRFSRATTDRPSVGPYSYSYIIQPCPASCIGTGGIHATSSGGLEECWPPRKAKARLYFVPGDES